MCKIILSAAAALRPSRDQQTTRRAIFIIRFFSQHAIFFSSKEHDLSVLLQQWVNTTSIKSHWSFTFVELNSLRSSFLTRSDSSKVKSSKDPIWCRIKSAQFSPLEFWWPRASQLSLAFTGYFSMDPWDAFLLTMINLNKWNGSPQQHTNRF